MSDFTAARLVLRDAAFDSAEALSLIAELQDEYRVRYGGPDETPVDPAEFAAPRGLFVVAELNGELAGCVGLRAHDDGLVEMKRMYVRPAFRRLGLARKLLDAAELRAAALGYRRLILETGTKQPEAVALYRGSGYLPYPGFGLYADSGDALYFAKEL